MAKHPSKQMVVRGIVHYATSWNGFILSVPTRVVMYKLTSGADVRRSDIDEVLYTAPGGMSAVDAAVVSETFKLEMNEGKVVCPMNAGDALKEHGVKEEDIDRTDGERVCTVADKFFADKLACMVRDALENARCS